MATKKKARKMSAGIKTAMEVGAGVLAVTAAAGAGYYFYGSKNAKKHRAAVAKWAHSLKSEVEREARKMQKLDKKVIQTIVDRVAKTYKASKTIDPMALMAVANELKANWKAIQAEVQKAEKTVKSAAKKRAKAGVKKSAKRRG